MLAEIPACDVPYGAAALSAHDAAWPCYANDNCEEFSITRYDLFGGL